MKPWPSCSRVQKKCLGLNLAVGNFTWTGVSISSISLSFHLTTVFPDLILSPQIFFSSVQAMCASFFTGSVDATTTLPAYTHPLPSCTTRTCSSMGTVAKLYARIKVLSCFSATSRRQALSCSMMQATSSVEHSSDCSSKASCFTVKGASVGCLSSLSVGIASRGSFLMLASSGSCLHRFLVGDASSVFTRLVFDPVSSCWRWDG